MVILKEKAASTKQVGSTVTNPIHTVKEIDTVLPESSMWHLTKEGKNRVGTENKITRANSNRGMKTSVLTKDFDP